MIKIDIILGSKDVSPCREEMICMSGILVSIVTNSVLANRGTVLRITARCNDGYMKLDDGGENT